MNSARNIKIHGYTQWFAVTPSVDIYLNGQLIGHVQKDGIVEVRLDSPCQLKFKCNLRSATIDVNPSIDTDIYLSWDRMFGCLIANKTAGNEVVGGANNTYIYSSSDFDKPKIVLDILSFIIPIIGIILYFANKQDKPNSAKSYIICAACGMALNAVLLALG